jgi:hypothetical protein
MPNYGQTPLDHDTISAVMARHERARREGLIHEWLSFMLGGLQEAGTLSNGQIIEHAERACGEWDM